MRLAGSCVAIAWRCRPGPPSAATAPEAPVARAEVFQDGTTEVVLEPFRFTNPVALTALAELLAYLHDRGRQSLASS